MKVISMLGGLGSQMFKYAFMLELKSLDDCYIDTIPYRLMEMWNGYELERIFGIHERDISEYIEDKEIKQFKKKNINYKTAAKINMERMNKGKPILFIFRGYLYPQTTRKMLLWSTLTYNKFKRIIRRNNIEQDRYPFLYKTCLFSIYYDEFNHTSDMYIGRGKHKEYFKEIFTFPEFNNSKNAKCAEAMKRKESVALHIRRSDHMYDNQKLFDENYFKKSVSYIRERSCDPVFYIFSDETDWCRNNLEQLGLTREEVVFVDWNKGEDSFRDMQLMTYCKHNILAISSFSWWGYYLSIRKNKIVCAPNGYWLEVPTHF